MEKILIDPMNCSREEYVELIYYLEDNCWNFEKVKHPTVQDRTFKVVGRRNEKGVQAAKRVYVTKDKFDLYGEPQMKRYADIYGLGIAYELIETKWVVVATIRNDDPLIGRSEKRREDNRKKD